MNNNNDMSIELDDITANNNNNNQTHHKSLPNPILKLEQLASQSAFSIVHEPAKIDAPRSLLSRRLTFTITLTFITGLLTMLFLIFESTTVNRQTSEVTEECPVTIEPLLIRDMKPSSEYTFSLVHEFHLTSTKDECQNLITLDFTRATSYQNRFQCFRPNLTEAGMECWTIERGTWLLLDEDGDDIEYGLIFNSRLLDIPSSYCIDAPLRCAYIMFLNTTTEESCIRFTDKSDACFKTETSRALSVNVNDLCDMIIQLSLPHQCEIEIGNGVLTILSLTLSNAATSFTISLNIAFFLWSFTLSQALVAGNNEDDNKEQESINPSIEKSINRQIRVQDSLMNITSGGLVDMLTSQNLTNMLDNPNNDENDGIRQRRPPVLSFDETIE